MDLKTYLSSLADEETRTQFASRCDTSLGHLRNCIYTGGKRLAPVTCVAVEIQSGRAVTRRDLRPDDWHRIWPELVTADHPAPEAKAA
jgi:DNA-binding transcriptional regulator YdaS (Cro superfamily)